MVLAAQLLGAVRAQQRACLPPIVQPDSACRSYLLLPLNNNPQVMIYLKCGATTALLSGTETTTCVYSLVLQTPIACIDGAQTRYGLTYAWTDSFTSGTAPTSAQCKNWNTFLVRE